MFKSTKTSFIVRGIAFTTLGLLCFFSKATPETLSLIAGLALLVSGVVFFVMRLKSFVKGFETMRLSLALLMLVMGGLICLLRKDIVVTVLGIFVIFEGLDFILSSIKFARAKAPAWWLMMIAGLAVVGLGIATFINKTPIVDGIFVKTITWFLGFGFIGIGICCFVGLAGAETLEKFIEEKNRNAKDDAKEDYVEAEVVS